MDEERIIKDNQRSQKFNSKFTKTKRSNKSHANTNTNTNTNTNKHTLYLKSNDSNPLVNVYLDTQQYVTANKLFAEESIIYDINEVFPSKNNRPGGGVHKGSKTKEEEIFRKSNLFSTLDEKYYPLNKYDIIYSPSVTVIKNAQYELIYNFDVSVISCSALGKPDQIMLAGKTFTYLNPDDYQLMRKIRYQRN